MVLTNFISRILGDTCWLNVCVPGSSGTLATPAGVWSKVVEFANFVFAGAALLCVLLIIYGGIQFMTSAGEAEKVESGTATIKNAIIGLVIIFLSGLIINAVFLFASTGSI